ncbi:hypothetical protein [Streptomyces griseoluteus]|uniref:hypothetical protein n=1 Tax=Streptomyces griseoluteus TaxID=29306 RepID=UPI003656B4B7
MLASPSAALDSSTAQLPGIAEEWLLLTSLAGVATWVCAVAQQEAVAERRHGRQGGPGDMAVDATTEAPGAEGAGGGPVNRLP